MNRESFFLPSDVLPSWVEYPHAFCRIVEQSLINLKPWHIFKGEEALLRFQGLAKRYPTREIFPFAYRQDNDDLACWTRGMGEKVFIIHDFASPGYEDESDFEDVWTWFRRAIEETIAWD